MGHTEVAQAPGQGGKNGDRAVGRSRVGRRVVGGGHGQVPGHGLGVGQNRIQPAGLLHAEAQHHHQRDGHHDALDQVGDRRRQKAAHGRVYHDHQSADDHGGQVIQPQQAGEQLTAGRKAGGGVGHEEHHDHHGRNAAEQVFVVMIPLGKEFGHGNGPQPVAVHADALGHHQPVDVGAHRQADGRPGGITDAAQVSHAG